jgi:hypothetical protein
MILHLPATRRRRARHRLSAVDRLTLAVGAFCLTQLVIVVVASGLHLAHLI